MNVDQVARVIAAAAAFIIVAGPYIVAAVVAAAGYVRERLSAVAEAQKEWTLPFSTKAVLALFLAYVAISGSPSSKFAPQKGVNVSTPESKLREAVKPVSVAMKNATTGDRISWADVWMKSAAVVAGEATSSEVIFTDTRSLRAFTIISLEIGWRRLGGNPPGKYAGLREAVESAFKDFLSDEIKPVTPQMRESYVELAKAIAWAGMAKE